MNNQRHNEFLMTQVAKKLKELRSVKKLTQAEVYRQTKIHIGRIESGNSNITMSSLSELCKFYQISFEDFFSPPFRLFTAPCLIGSSVSKLHVFPLRDRGTPAR